MIRFRKGRIPIVPMTESLALHGAKAKAVKRPWPACLPRKGFPRSVIQRKTLYPAGAEFPLVTLQKSAGEAVGEERSYTTNSEPTRRRRTEMELCKEMYKPRQLLNSKDSAFLSCPTHPKYLGNFPGVGATEPKPYNSLPESAYSVNGRRSPEYGTAAYGFSLEL